MKLTGAIFDLDGTLLDSMPVWDTLGEDYLRSKGKNPLSDVKARLKTMSLLEAAEYFQKEYHFKETTDEIICEINEMITYKYRYEVQLKTHVTMFLHKLQRENVKMCIATATDRYLVEPALKRLQIADFFTGILTCSEVGFSKESAEIYEKALELIHTEKTKTIVFEDALHAMKAAKNAGFTVIGVYDSSAGQDADDIKKGADRYINSFKECEERLL